MLYISEFNNIMQIVYKCINYFKLFSLYWRIIFKFKKNIGIYILFYYTNITIPKSFLNCYSYAIITFFGLEDVQTLRKKIYASDRL